MAALKNKRHEQFAQELVIALKLGGTQGDAYSRAGYSATRNAAEASASRMLSNVKNGIAKRVNELTSNGARRAEVTVETLLDRLERNITNADKAGNHGAVNGSLKLMADLRGLLINKVEVGAPGAFDACNSIEDLVRVFLADQTPSEALAALDEMRGAIEQYAGDRAIMLPLQHSS